MTTKPAASLVDDLRTQTAEAERLEAEAQIAQCRADEAKAEVERVRKQAAAAAPKR